MPNLRIISDNAADRATITASTTSGSLAASLMQNDLKGQAHRSTGTSVTYTLAWVSAENIGAVALPASNLSATATVRARLYDGAAALLADTGAVLACAGLNLGARAWSYPRNVNSFALGGASKAALWFGTNYPTARSCVIDVVDTASEAGYIDCARIVAGSWWSPTYNADYGAQFTPMDTSTNERTDAGDNQTSRGTVHDTVSLSLQGLSETERAQVRKIIRDAGTWRNFFLSVLPANASAVAEQDHMIFGKRAVSPISFDFYSAFGHKLDIESW